MDIFSSEGVSFYLLRWIHFLAGITWIGILYYFNFIQGAFFAETDAQTKNNATSKLVPRALWWFRWGAMFTFLSGLSMILGLFHMYGSEYLDGSRFALILVGATMGTLMFMNVWMVIWPAQKVVIASTNAVLGGGQADPAAAGRARRAFLASRTNTLFSAPMLFFMGAAHLSQVLGHPGAVGLVLMIALILIIEANALVGTDGPLKKPIEKPRDLIISSFVLAGILYFMFQGFAG